ncbi:MAG TPA: SpoVR family protein [Sphingobacteriaceae bacterium]|nr:SpoVR family protein [Sphingobacteriaceae bacterium]
MTVCGPGGGALPGARRMDRVLDTARDLGLDFFDLRIEVVPSDVLAQIAAYGLPIRAAHWSHGKVFQRMRLHGRMGLSKIFELVINNDPAYAFYLDTNTEADNLLLTAHVAAHSDFFKHNELFAGTRRDMVDEAARSAARVAAYRQRYGQERVEALMDTAFALHRHVDLHRGPHRRPYPGRRVVMRRRPAGPYDDLAGRQDYSMSESVEGDQVPPHPERDLLWFLSRYAPLDDWERDVLGIIRHESFYFYPQFATKIINEGWACFWHVEILQQHADLTPAETLEVMRLHAAVVAPGPGLSVNPYYLGFKILQDVERRLGREHLFALRSAEDDFSLIRNYLTGELCRELNLFAYGPGCSLHPVPDQRCPNCRHIRLESRSAGKVRDALLAPRYNYGVPRIVVVDTARGVLTLEQQDRRQRGMDLDYATRTLQAMQRLWQGPVRLLCAGEDGRQVTLTCSDGGVDKDYA